DPALAELGANEEAAAVALHRAVVLGLLVAHRRRKLRLGRRRRRLGGAAFAVLLPRLGHGLGVRGLGGAGQQQRGEDDCMTVHGLPPVVWTIPASVRKGDQAANALAGRGKPRATTTPAAPACG